MNRNRTRPMFRRNPNPGGVGAPIPSLEDLAWEAPLLHYWNAADAVVSSSIVQSLPPRAGIYTLAKGTSGPLYSATGGPSGVPSMQTTGLSSRLTASVAGTHLPNDICIGLLMDIPVTPAGGGAVMCGVSSTTGHRNRLAGSGDASSPYDVIHHVSSGGAYSVGSMVIQDTWTWVLFGSKNGGGSGYLATRAHGVSSSYGGIFNPNTSFPTPSTVHIGSEGSAVSSNNIKVAAMAIWDIGTNYDSTPRALLNAADLATLNAFSLTTWGIAA